MSRSVRLHWSTAGIVSFLLATAPLFAGEVLISAPRGLHESDTDEGVPRLAEVGEGCLEERIADDLERHGTMGRIDPEDLLEQSRQFYEGRRRHRIESDGIAGDNWKSLGPSNGAGRASGIAFDPSSPGTVVIGTAGGGAWKSTDSGANWSSLTDTIPNLSVGAIAVAPTDPATILLGTGEGGIAGDFIPGIGLLWSTDGGANWNLPASVLATQFYRISIHPSDAKEILVGTNAGAFRSTAGPAGPWISVIRGPAANGVTAYGDVTEILRDPNDPKIVYATTFDRRAWCARNTCTGNGIQSSSVLRSIDGGKTWALSSTGLPVSTKDMRVGRFSLAISRSTPGILYLATTTFDNAAGTETGHIYKTSDGAASWVETAFASGTSTTVKGYLGTQSWYGNVITVSPTDPGAVFAGGVTYVRSLDGGATWSVPAMRSVHVDVHDLQWDPNGVLYIANDGGIWSTADFGVTAVSRNANIATRQFYAIANDPSNPKRVFGGQQDNGTIRRPDSGGTAWDAFFGGDGFQCAVMPSHPEIVYSSYQTGHVLRAIDGGGPAPNSFDLSPLYASTEAPPFATIVARHPVDPSTLFTVSYRVWKSTSGGNVWVPLPVTTTDGSPRSLTSTIRSLAIAPSDPNVMMVAKAGRVFRSADGGKSWVEVSTGLPGRTINQLDIDPRDPQISYAAIAGLNPISVFATTNGGATWSARSNGLPAFSAQVVRVDPTDSDTLFAGTDVGVYRSNDRGISWARYGSGMPAVSVYDIAILRDGSVVRAATHGRGVWELVTAPVANNAPVATITSPAKSTKAAKNAIVRFAGNVSDADPGDGISAAWSFSDDWSTVPDNGGASHQFVRGGVYPVTLLATDARGAVGSSTVYVTVTEGGEECSAPIEIPPAGPFPYTTTFNTNGSKTQTSDPWGNLSCFSFTGQNSIWLSFTPEVSGTYQFSLCGSTVSAVVAGFTGPACGPYIAGGLCLRRSTKTNDCAADPVAAATLTAGVPFRLLVTNYFSNDFGPVSLTISKSAPLSTVVHSVTPSAGQAGTEVIIMGSGFDSDATVEIGGARAERVVVVNANTITAVATAGVPAGPASVVVTGPGGVRATLGSGFIYAAPPPPSGRRPGRR